MRDLVASCYTTLNETKDYLDIARATTTYDTFLTALITTICGFVEDYCNRRFYIDTYQDNIDIKDDYVDAIKVSQSPINTVVAVTDNGVAVPVAEYKIYKDEGMIKKVSATHYYALSARYSKGFWTKGNQKAEVYYTAGFIEVPYGLKLAIWKVIGMNFNMRKYEGIRSMKLGDFSFSKFNAQLPLDIVGVLKPYVRVGV